MTNQMGAIVRQSGLPPEYFERYDESDDRLFYLYPRLTAHIDELARCAVTQLIREELPHGGCLLDLMSSYVSHLPTDIPLTRVVGLGLNEDEMRLNPQLHEYVVHDLNDNPQLPFADATFDGVVCTVSVQYMTRPVEVFAEVARILKP